VATKFLKKGVRKVVITLGSKGAFWAAEWKSGYVNAEKINVVNTTATGDTFMGAYTVQAVTGNGREIGEIMRLAYRATGKTCEKAGARR
ncbi:Ribokinase-like protein, partial [Hyaloscypha sp. PMI_1271]